MMALVNDIASGDYIDRRGWNPAHFPLSDSDGRHPPADRRQQADRCVCSIGVQVV
jgi:hypothetical protein